jgi:fructose-1,6-bisphosphatase/inositol monophosphatase family enzyme
MDDIKQVLEFAKKLSLDVGKGLIEKQGSSVKLADKSNKTIQINSDLWAHETYVAAINKQFPDHKIISEESKQTATITDNSFYWIIDPLDGTTNYKNQSDIFGTSIALYQGSEPLLGVINLPKLNKIYAELINQQTPNKESHSDNLKSHEVIFDRGNMRSENQIEELSQVNKSLLQKTRTVRMFGSASYSLVAVCVGYNSFIGCQMALYDVAAGVIFAKNRGLNILQFNGDNYETAAISDIVICHPSSKEDYIKMLRN